MIWVFKTTIKSKVQVRKVAPILNELVLPEGKWNVDLEDCDKILRIENAVTLINESYIIAQLKASGYCVEVLND
ncbi:hypothetical protein EMA8858_03227 [Emticicia aquatica]|jgi:hypothetical protein|uniref:HMA domain-containing protein n=1 Tax=Emticicia aquatica TaxID=1681835 RepID=A0ABN8EVN6_9BACT|nr:hypothetical protein [Emticicia aquatica]CAH0997090.1 hypothetical protein EMA8858_03227 [Emticicia aquatica]